MRTTTAANLVQTLGLTFFNYPSHRNVKVDILVPPVWCPPSERPWPDGRTSAPSSSCCTGTTAGWLLRPIGESAVSAADEAGCEGLFGASGGCEYAGSECNLLRSNTCRQQEIGSAYEGRKLDRAQDREKPERTSRSARCGFDGGIHAKGVDQPGHRGCYMADVYRFWPAKKAAIRTVAPFSKPADVQRRRPQQNYGYKWGGSGQLKPTPARIITARHRAILCSMEFGPPVKRFVEQENSDKKILLFSVLPFIRPVRADAIRLQRGPTRGLRSTLAKMRLRGLLRHREDVRTNHRFYIHGTSAMSYEASGGSDDWAHGSLEVPYSLTVELPDDGAYGFLLPPAYIRNVGSEAVRGLLAMLRTIHDLETNTNFYRTRCLAHTAASRLLAAPE
uniref:Peptidase_M14 domain-containing protein n=1 Tax=Macrostomum lignano TaxID=282301 RepID=A0A1I8FGL9_9PLAT